MVKTKWRGIATTSKRINERKAVTTINRYGQKTMRLPRITNDKRWVGFAGITGVSRKVARLVPKCNYYVEPFAGAVKVYQMVPKNKYRTAILNDKSTFVNDWLKREFPKARVTKLDFATCIKKFDSPKTFFLIDQPWNKSFYDQGFSIFNRKSLSEYDWEVTELCEKMKGKFIITTRTENKRMRKSGFKHKTITSEYQLSGHFPKVLLTSNCL